VLALAGLVWPSRGAVTGAKTLHGHVPPVVAQLTKTGDLAATNDLHLAIGLQLRNTEALDALLSQVSDPASPSYGQYLSTDEFTRQFAPTEADYQAVVDFATAQGLTVTATTANRMLLEVHGQADAVQRAFKVALHTYQHPTENRTFYAPDTEPSVPAELAILDISGLNNYTRPHSHLHLRPDAAKTAVAKGRKLGSSPGGSYIGNDFRAAYVPGAPQTGAGQNVALVEFDGYLGSDIQEYETLAGLPTLSLTNILLNGFSGFPTGSGGEVEVSLDIEMLVSMAPGLNEALVYEGNPFNFQPNVVLNQIALDNSARQITCSWGWGGGPSAATEQIFKEMVVQGQTFYNASGDNDAFLPGEVDNPGYAGSPSSDPFVTQVGATTLSTTGPGGAFQSETVWNWDIEFGPGADGIGSSGGISSYYPIPWWQTNVNMAANGGSTTFRNIPDVALTGDNVFVIADGGVYYPGTGGTSCAAPLWAAFTALVNQQAASMGHAAIGFINPALYALAYGPNYTNVFNDVTTGNNTWSASPNAFFATNNYDLCTGLGSPHGTNLIMALASLTGIQLSPSGLIPAPKQPWGATLSVMNGGNPNGLWLLYLQDDSMNGFSGTNMNGWAVNLTTANPIGFPADNQLYVNTAVNGQTFGNATNVAMTPGSSWRMTLALTNYGPSVSSNVYVGDTLPDATAVTLVSASATLGTITNYGGNLVWQVATNLPVNAGGALTLNLLVNTSGSYTNSATVYASTLDPNPDDDTVTVVATAAVTAPPVLSPLFVHGPGGGFQLSVANDPGSTVVIQAATNLSALNLPSAWVPVFTNVSPFTFTNFDSTSFPNRFYRAVISQ
jgi:uncharacterized repeat protein (TIGR01451 family)